LEEFDLQLAVTTLLLVFHQVGFRKEYYCSFVLLDLLPGTFHTTTSALFRSPMYRHMLQFILSSSMLSVIMPLHEISYKKIQEMAENNRVAAESYQNKNRYIYYSDYLTLRQYCGLIQLTVYSVAGSKSAGEWF
jgi:hypothetical protein